MRRWWYGCAVLLLACSGCAMGPFFGGGYPSYPSGGYPDGPGRAYPGDPYLGGGFDPVFLCESRDNRTRRCHADTRGGVRLHRQLSNTACVRGQSWGIERDGVWVSGGCRAEFITGQGYGGGAPGGGTGLVRCESNDMGTRRCPADTRRGVRLVNRLSSSPCVEGQNWGAGNGEIWVTRGCRAEFAVGGGGGGGHRPPPVPPSQVIRCESEDKRQRRCPANVARNVTLVRQLSNSPCIRGSTWDWDRSGVWVSSGCRAEFSIR